MALPTGRVCEGDDELREGNKVGYCATVLREIRAAARAKFDQTKATACVAAAAKATTLPDRRTLSDIAGAIAVCRGVVVGGQPPDAACDRNMECKSGLLCIKQRCIAAAAVGQPCTKLTDDGLTAATSTCKAHLRCIEDQCRLVKPTQPAKQGEACRHDNCISGLYCARADKAICRPKQKAGASCSHSRECLGRCSRKDGRLCVDYCGSG